KRGAKGSLFKLKQHHVEWIINYVDEKPTAVLDQNNQALCKTFENENLSVIRSALHRFMRVACALNHIEVIEQRKVEVEKWIADEDMDFQKNCVFIDEAGFNINISRNR
ncbi:hypothetical protein BDF21DRAFT_320396, partial [Thamnidium elegans]